MEENANELNILEVEVLLGPRSWRWRVDNNYDVLFCYLSRS